MLTKAWKIVTSVFAAGLLFLGLADVPDQARRWQQGLVTAWSLIAPYISGELGRWCLVAFAGSLLLWAWWPRKPSLAIEATVVPAEPRPKLVPAEQVPLLTPGRTPAERVFSPRTPAELLAMAGPHIIGTKREALVAPHLGTWLNVTGLVDDIRSSGDTTWVHVSIDRRITAGLSPVSMRFRGQSARDILLTLDRGDSISATGRIETINTVQIKLTDCELLSYRGTAAAGVTTLEERLSTPRRHREPESEGAGIVVDANPMILPPKPKLTIDVGQGTATTADGKLWKTVDLTVTNSGDPFTLVAHAKITADSKNEALGAAWHYNERPVKGGHGTSKFCVATLGEIELGYATRQWLVKARGEQMEPTGRWHGPGSLSFDIEWTFYIEMDSKLTRLASIITRIDVDPELNRFTIEKHEISNTPALALTPA